MASSPTVERYAVRQARMRRRASMTVLLVLVGLLSALIGAGSAEAGLAKEFSVFAQCPVNVPGVRTCVYSTTTSGEFHLGSKTVPVTKTVVLQGGLSQTSTELVPAANGDTVSKTSLVVPGGILGVELLPPLTEVTATAEQAGPINVNLTNFGTGDGAAVSLPLKVKLDNPALGSACYVGSGTEPVSLQLTTGTTSPPPPNTPISGAKGTVTFQGAGKINVVSNTSLVDNTFAAPGANGCGGLLALLVDPSVDLQTGLPAASGKNTAILNGEFRATGVDALVAQRALPEIGRCVKQPAERREGTTFYSGHYADPGCLHQFPTIPSTVGKYEWMPGTAAGKSFTGSSLTATLETVGGSKIVCTNSSSSGEYTGTKTATLGLTLTGCAIKSSKAPCQSTGAAAGEVKAPSLQGELGFIKDQVVEHNLIATVGFDLKHSPTIIAGECGASKEALSITGSVIAPVATVNKMVPSYLLKLKAVGGKQQPEAFEEMPNDTLSTTLGSGSAEQSGLTVSEKVTNSEKLEIKAVAE